MVKGCDHSADLVLGMTMRISSPECGCACVIGPGAALVRAGVDAPVPLVHGPRVCSLGVTQSAFISVVLFSSRLFKHVKLLGLCQ